MSVARLAKKSAKIEIKIAPTAIAKKIKNKKTGVGIPRLCFLLSFSFSPFSFFVFPFLLQAQRKNSSKATVKKRPSFVGTFSKSDSIFLNQRTIG